jgi:serine/threonine protein kinase
MARYRFGAKIGSGGFAEVVECTRVEDDAKFAAKRLLSRDPEQLKRFAREVRMQATLSHPNILPVLARNLDSDPPWVVLPRADCNMRELLKGKTGGELVWTVIQAATGLMHAHANGVVHRDLKPENILAFKENVRGYRICVADFGLGRFIDRDSTEITLVNMGLGTIAYMAPEQFTDAVNADQRADVFAMGKILYEVLTGAVPYPSIDLQRVPAVYRYIIQKATHLDKSRRYQSMDNFVKDLEIAGDSPDQLTKPAERIKSFIKGHRKGAAVSAGDAERVVKIFIENLDDNSVLLSELPQLPGEILAAMCEHCPTEVEELIKAYDEEVAGGISFSYCDTAANFFEQLWHLCKSDVVRQIVINRLANMGADNNRWHVGEVLGRLARGLDGSDPALLALRDALAASRTVRDFNRQYLAGAGLPPVVRDILNCD